MMAAKPERPGIVSERDEALVRAGRYVRRGTISPNLLTVQRAVKDGIITWGAQPSDYPFTDPGRPACEPRGCPRGAAFSLFAGVVLAAGTWHGKHDLSSADMLPFVHASNPAIAPPRQASPFNHRLTRRGWETSR